MILYIIQLNIQLFFQNTKYIKRDYWQKVIKKIFDDEYNEENESKINTF